jgi:2-dehydro-3-deoxyphosphogluconate aldolase / (4S)-4-hydroxy-2-oxoglutarate aldolase
MAVVTPRDTVIRAIERERIIAVLRFDSPDACATAAEAIVDGGISILEVTLTTPGAIELIRDLASRSDALVGVGSVRTRKQLDRAIDAGARFMASPVLDEEIVRAAREGGIVAMPGAMTPTEIDHAWRAGADLVKVFPMPREGASYLRSILGPLPEIRLAPSGGVTPDTARAFLAAGAFALNVGSWMTHGEGGVLSPSEVSDRARQLVAAVKGK